MKKIFLFVASGILISGLATAQKKNRGTDGSSNVKYTLISDSEDFNYLGGGFGINFAGSGYNTNLGIDMGLNGHFGKLDIGGWYYRQTSGLTAGNNTSSDDGFSIYENSATNNFEIRAAYAISSSTENRNINVIVKATGNSQVKVLYYLPIPAREKTMIMAELGFNKGITFFKGEGTEYKGVMNGSSTVENIENRLETNMTYSILNFGVSRVRCARVQINTTDYGIKEEVYYNKLYGRISYLLNYKLDDVLIPTPGDDDNFFQYNLEKTEMSKVGLNLGYNSYTPNKVRSYWYVEGGLFPGPKGPIGTKIYAGMGFGLYISKLLN